MQSVNGMIQLAAMVLQIMRGTLEERRVRGKEGMQVKSLGANQGNPAWALGWVARGGSGVRVVTGGLQRFARCHRHGVALCQSSEAQCWLCRRCSLGAAGLKRLPTAS